MAIARNSYGPGTEKIAAYRPGDVILDQYLPHASAEEREAARENLHRLVRLLIRVHERIALEDPKPAICANPLPALELELHVRII